MLKKLLLSKQIKDKRAALAELEAKKEEFDKREAELAQSIEESKTEEEQRALDVMIDDLQKEIDENAGTKATLEDEIRSLEKELEELEAKDEEPVPGPEDPAPVKEERKEMRIMNTRRLFNMPEEQRAAIFARAEVKEFMTEIRACLAQKRALTNVGLTIPEVLLGIIRENIIEYSKLWKHVNLAQASGKGRLVVAGTFPEGVWTECCGKLNELSLVFNAVELDCYKVGGFIPVCNAALEDNDVDLADQVIVAVGAAIGFALDKAILYGTGVKMPLGIVTRLAQTSEPANYPDYARTWVDLHTSNIKALANNLTGAALVAAIVEAFGNAKGKYSRGGKVFVMNEKTYTALAAACVTTTADGRIVTAVLDTMPVIGGDIEVLDFIPDNVIIGGYFDLYKLLERKGITLEQSREAMFIEDMTVFKGVARYDGQPAIAEGFVAIGINNTTPNATMTFAPDTANESGQSTSTSTSTSNS